MITEKWLKNSVGARIIIIGALIILLMIPSLMIRSLITEREDRRTSAEAEISSKWGGNQIISGPIISIPFIEYFNDSEGKEYTKQDHIYILPEELNIIGDLNPEIRYRGIFKVVLYNTNLKFKGNFTLKDLKEQNIKNNSIELENANFVLGISDMRGVKDAIKINWNDSEIMGNPGIDDKDLFTSGISSKIQLNADESTYNFEFEINLNGSNDLHFIPVGKVTNVSLSSTWNNPSFNGEFLPESRQIDENGFKSQWRILHFNRNFPQIWRGDQYKIEASAFGVGLIFPVDEYQKTMRTVKYAFMFIGLTFLSFFIIEILNQKVIHPIQYLLIGFGLVLFYTLLLSLSEHIAFLYAYLFSSLSIVVMISLYTKSVLKNNFLVTVVAVILVILYGFLYVILQLQDYSLLIGSIGLFIFLAVVMYLTRKIDWFTVLKQKTDT